MLGSAVLTHTCFWMILPILYVDADAAGSSEGCYMLADAAVFAL